jgi:hypothetical protein
VNLNKPVLGILVGGVLGLLDGLAAPLQAPEVAPEAFAIAIGSTFKGVVVGLIAGFFARKVDSVPVGIAVGLAAGMFFAYLVASQPDALTGKHYYREIMLPGSLAGAVVGWVTQRYGTRSSAAKAAVALLLALAPLSVQAGEVSAHAKNGSVDAHTAFARVKSLAGDWEGTTAGSDSAPARVEFRLSGGGSTVVERMFPGTEHEMVTVYHMAGEDLVLTHYCAMGNQPRMKLVSGGAAGELVFDFVGGDNIEPATTTHMHTGRMTISPESYEARWTVYREGREAGSHGFSMKRAAR